MEIFGYHPDLKKWTEIGNSGMFRPEMLLPMGLPKVVLVLIYIIDDLDGIDRQRQKNKDNRRKERTFSVREERAGR